MHASWTTTRGPGGEVPEIAAMAGETMVAWLSEIDGYIGILMMNNEEAGIVQVITFWESQEVAERHMAARLQLRDRITATVNVEVVETASYEVTFADLPALREPAA